MSRADVSACEANHSAIIAANARENAPRRRQTGSEGVLGVPEPAQAGGDGRSIAKVQRMNSSWPRKSSARSTSWRISQTN
jgi:hypothetical protein